MRLKSSQSSTGFMLGVMGRDEDTDGGQDHHDRDVDGDDQVILALTLQVHRGLVEHHQNDVLIDIYF